jgi:ribosome-associated heat shock protein Hsp15
MDGIRIDKWLWAARFFKTRALAARACELGRVQSNRGPVKPSREVRVGDFFEIAREHDELRIQVLALSAIRGPATVAETLYQETEESRELRLRLAQERKAAGLFTPAPQGRPTKRDRRRIIQFRNNAQRNSQLDHDE